MLLFSYCILPAMSNNKRRCNRILSEFLICLISLLVRGETHKALQVSLHRTHSTNNRIWATFWGAHQRFFKQLWLVSYMHIHIAPLSSVIQVYISYCSLALLTLHPW